MGKGKGFIEEFKKFIMRGNVMDMAVGVIVGGAFTAIVTSSGKGYKAANRSYKKMISSRLI